MIDFYIISNASRAASYGIGTYRNQLVACMASSENVRVNFIEVYADVSEFTKETDDNGRIHYKMPAVSCTMEDEISCKNAYYYISQQVNGDSSSSLVFQFNYFQHYPLAALLKAGYPKCRIILTIHYFNWCFELKGNDSMFRNYISSPIEYDKKEDPGFRQMMNVRSNYELERDFMRLSDDVVVLSKATKDIIVNDYGISENKLTLIYNGIPSPKQGQEDADGMEVFADMDCKYLLFVGRLDEIKGVPYLIKAFRKLSGEYRELRLIVVGDGDYPACLSASEGIWDKVIFTGKLSKEMIERIYPRVLAGILPSFHEQCSYSAVEMMAHGIPMVITDTTGLNEMLEEIPSCIVAIDRQDFSEDEFVDSLYEHIRHLISDEARLRKVSALVYELYLRRYTLSLMCDGYRNLLDRERRSLFSDDLLCMIDRKMISLVDSCPDIDTSFFGMTGIGCYLWHRIELLRDTDLPSDSSRSLLLQEYMIYWMDWIDESVTDDPSSAPDELRILIRKLNDSGFYVSVAKRLAEKTGAIGSLGTLSEDAVLSNALRIFRSNV